jgi:hypothetical protein
MNLARGKLSLPGQRSLARLPRSHPVDGMGVLSLYPACKSFMLMGDSFPSIWFSSSRQVRPLRLTRHA